MDSFQPGDLCEVVGTDPPVLVVVEGVSVRPRYVRNERGDVIGLDTEPDPEPVAEYAVTVADPDEGRNSWTLPAAKLRLVSR